MLAKLEKLHSRSQTLWVNSEVSIEEMWGESLLAIPNILGNLCLASCSNDYDDIETFNTTSYDIKTTNIQKEFDFKENTCMTKPVFASLHSIRIETSHTQDSIDYQKFLCERIYINRDLKTAKSKDDSISCWFLCWFNQVFPRAHEEKRFMHVHTRSQQSSWYKSQLFLVQEACSRQRQEPSSWSLFWLDHWNPLFQVQPAVVKEIKMQDHQGIS